MAKNESAAPARTGGKTSKPGAPTAGDQPQKDNQGENTGLDNSAGAVNQPPRLETPTPGSQSQLDNQNGGDLQLQAGSTDGQLPDNQGAGDQGGQTEADSTGASAASSIANFLTESTYGLEVTSSQAGFRRAGRAWSTTPTVVKLSELTEEQARQIKGEPMLSARIVLIQAEEA